MSSMSASDGRSEVAREQPRHDQLLAQRAVGPLAGEGELAKQARVGVLGWWGCWIAAHVHVDCGPFGSSAVPHS
jgi:hypothetical protein